MGSCMKSIFWTCYQWEWECFFFFNVNTCHCSKHSMKVPKYFSEKKNYTHRKKFIIEWMNVEVSMNFLTKHVKRAFNQRLLNWWIQYSFFSNITHFIFVPISIASSITQTIGIKAKFSEISRKHGRALRLSYLSTELSSSVDRPRMISSQNK